MTIKKTRLLITVLAVGVLGVGVACSNKSNVAEKDNVENALKQADIRG